MRQLQDLRDQLQEAELGILRVETGEMSGVSKNRGTQKWMVKRMENPIKMDD